MTKVNLAFGSGFLLFCLNQFRTLIVSLFTFSVSILTQISFNRCPQCQRYMPVVKTLGLWSLPDILVIHLKRFRQ